MKNVLRAILVLFVLTSTFALAAPKKKKKAGPPPDPRSLVSAVTPGSSPGTVEANTTILVDGEKATFDDIHVGMKVLTQTTPDSSAPEIDLKTMSTSESAVGGGGGGGDTGGGDAGGQ